MVLLWSEQPGIISALSATEQSRSRAARVLAETWITIRTAAGARLRSSRNRA